MKFDPDDYRWTAYVLDELDPASRLELEETLTQSHAARELVEEIRDSVDRIGSELDSEAELSLTEDQLTSILSSEPGVQGRFTWADISFGDRMTGRIVVGMAAMLVVAGVCAGVLISALWKIDANPAMLAAADQATASIDLPAENPSASETDVLTIEAAHSSGQRASGGGQPSALDEAASFTRVDNRSGVYGHPFVSAQLQPSVKVSLTSGTSKYDQVRETIWNETLPAAETFQPSDLLDYFSFDYGAAAEKRPIWVEMDAMTCPWNAGHRLLRIGLQARRDGKGQLRPVNFVMLIDGLEVRRNGLDRAVLLEAITALRAKLGGEDRLVMIDGSRLGGEVIRLLASEASVAALEKLTMVPIGGAVDIGVGNKLIVPKVIAELDRTLRNEVVLVVGDSPTERIDERIRIIGLLENELSGGAEFSILGLGTALGEWALRALDREDPALLWGPVDSIAQANHFWGRLLDRDQAEVARDLEMEVAFNPEKVAAYRQIGQSRLTERGPSAEPVALAGPTISSGQQLTSLFEVVPVRQAEIPEPRQATEELVVAPQRNQVRTQNMLTVKLNYRLVNDNQRVREVYPFVDQGRALRQATEDQKFAASVAAYGMIMSDAPLRGTINHYGVLELAQEGLGKDADGKRGDFLDMVRRTIKLILDRGRRVKG